LDNGDRDAQKRYFQRHVFPHINKALVEQLHPQKAYKLNQIANEVRYIEDWPFCGAHATDSC
jgi:hypothetical protein